MSVNLLNMQKIIIFVACIYAHTMYDLAKLQAYQPISILFCVFVLPCIENVVNITDDIKDSIRNYIKPDIYLSTTINKTLSITCTKPV